MSQNDANKLFARDLKYLVDPKYSVAPVRKHRSLLAVLVGSGVIVAGVWATSWLLIPSLTSDSPIETSTQATKPEQTQIPPQAEKIAKQSLTAKSDIPKLQPEITEVKAAKTLNQSPIVETEVAKNEPEAVNDETEQAMPDADLREPFLAWQDYQVKSGDSLARIFKKHDLKASDAIRIAGHKQANRIKNLMPGQKLRIGYDEDRKLRALSLELPPNKNLMIEFARDGSLQFSETQAEFEKRERAVGAIIESSLFKAGAKAGLNDKSILQLVGIFGWDIDFAMDLRKGDRFTVIYEDLFDGKSSKGTGDILGAEFISQERKLHAFRHVNEQGLVEYFDAEGNNLRGTFLRTPMKISRITSGFSKKRLHPILKKWRAHTGVDYAAPRGTPVLATANGRVSFLGNKQGYGKTIVLRHGGKYSTLYAHLSSYKSKIRPGTNVKQGQIIGFVGKTGLATAPHLHYEFRVHGEHRDPLKYKSPKAEPIPKPELEQFLANAHHWMDAMAQHNAIQLAQREPGED